MTQTPRVRAVLTSSCILAAFAILDGCGPVRNQQFRSSFLPPAPVAESSTEYLSEPPPVTKEFAKELPQLFPVEPALAKNSAADLRLRKAEDKFNEGKQAYQAGNIVEARRLFNEAVDVLLSSPESADRGKAERRLDQMVDAIYRYDMNGLGAAEDADKVVFDKAPLDGILEMTFPIDPGLKPKVSEEVHATVSQLPLEESDSVLSYIHFFSTEGGKKILTAGLRRAGRYRPLIERVLSEEGVPQELIYLAQAESGFLPRAVSYKSAAGMWQFLAWRGKEYGLQVTKYGDDRLDPEKATRAAARHLRDLYQQLGDWYLAMAAYNCGPGCVDRAVQRTGYADFWTLRNLNVLPKETANYVPAILAITIMAKNPKDYGLEGIEVDRPIEYDTVKLDTTTNLALVADAVERPISEIRELNPSLLRGIAPSGAELRVPKGATHALMAALENVPATKRDSWRMHRVEKGESLAAIAKRYGTPASAIVSANNGAIAAPEAGDVLLIPASYREPVPTVRRAAATPKRTAARTTGTAAARTTVARTHTVAKASTHSTVRNTAVRRVPAKVLNQRAPARRMRTAHAGSAAGGQ